MKAAISIGTNILAIIGALSASYSYPYEPHPPYMMVALLCYSLAFLGRSEWFR